MKPLSTATLLKIWESGTQLSLTERALLLLNAASSDTAAADLSIGQRDARLLQLRQWMFGNKLSCMVQCPACSQKMEWENEINDFQLQPVLENGVQKQHEVYLDGYKVIFRSPTSRDMAALHKSMPQIEKERYLLQQCIISIKNDGKECEPANLPTTVLQEVEAELAKENTQADLCISLQCANCAHQWESVFDIQYYLWNELNAWAKNIFQEIYTLAKYFGWSEAAILQMTSQRRRMYLNMILA